MSYDTGLELKVGIFVSIAFLILTMMIFSISDFDFLQEGYEINVVFSFANGITESSPVRLAGVTVGEVKKTEIYFDKDFHSTMVRLNVWIKDGVKIERDAVARINQLGLLGEKYLEISPGSSKEFLHSGDTLIGATPVHMDDQVEQLGKMIGTINKLIKKIDDGKGTIGKLFNDDELYYQLTSFARNANIIASKIKNGNGTVGKLITDDSIYSNLEEFTADIKKHPWKLLHMPREDRSPKYYRNRKR